MNYLTLVKSVRFQTTLFNNYDILSHSRQLSLIGKGRSAAVFRVKNTRKVIKIFYPEHSYLSFKEMSIYKKLMKFHFCPHCYEYGLGYIVMDYIEGHTIFDCLVKGKYIPTHIIDTLDQYFEQIKKIGLYPSDMHLKNIILTPNETVKIIDVVRFNDPVRDQRWKHIKWAYDWFYHIRFVPQKYPVWFLSLIGYLYKKLSI